MTSPETQPPVLDMLRRRVMSKCVEIETTLGDRMTPWRRWQPVHIQLSHMGFRLLDDPEQTELELTAMLWFCNMWLDLAMVADGVFWADPDEYR